MISVKKVRRIETNNMYKIKIDTSLTNEFYTSEGKGDRQVKNGDKYYMDV